MTLRRIVPLAASAFAVVFALTSAVAAQAMDRWVGTWKLNVEKSRYEAGPRPDFRSINPVVELKVLDGTLRITSGPINASFVNEVVFDGKPHPVNGRLERTTRVYRWIDDRTYEWVQRVDGRVTTTTHLQLSPDGQTHTVTTTGVDENGRAVKRVTVYERTATGTDQRPSSPASTSDR
jgi:hypothetical protein